ncbi:MAG: hypothetical protein JWO15_3869 [Sphingomonadales bacterium]|nr:hypothetical protein [Sphingomonadales bacterium]
MTADHAADAESLARVQAYLKPWAVFRGGRSLAHRADHHLFLADLRRVVALADARSDAR